MDVYDQDMNNHLVSTTYRVSGVRDDLDVKGILQRLYDVFAQQGMGQATVELAGNDQRLVVKHKADQQPDRDVIAKALSEAGNFKLLD